VRQECLDHVLVLDERHLQATLREYVAYYNAQRPHRSLALAPPLRTARGPGAQSGPVVARPVLGGLHHVYSRAA
jgi:putative transposase